MKTQAISPENSEQLTPNLLRETLENLAEPGYREFHLRTCPEAKHLLGVRIPIQRKLAKSIIKSGVYWNYLDGFEPYHYEETLILGLIIATAPMSLAERLDYTTWFLPFIDNWAICDTFCNSFRIKDDELKTYWQFLMQFKDSAEEYALRFILVMILNHFIRGEYLDQIFNLLDELNLQNPHVQQHYIEMAEAWLIAEIFTKFPDEVFDYLSHNQLSTFAHNKAIQKACESRRISDADKQRLRGMKL